MAIKTFTTGEVLTAADTNTYLANSGLVYVASTTFTSSSSIVVDNCFSSTYDNYRVTIDWLQNTASADLQLQMRDGSGNIATNYGFTSGGSYIVSGTGTFAGFNNSANNTQTSGFIGPVVSTYRGSAVMDVFNPNIARETNWTGTFLTTNATATITMANVIVRNLHNAATACTGFRLATSAGTATGVVTVFGYRKA